MPDSKARGVSNLPAAIPDVVDSPVVSATDVGTSRAYNNGAATVAISNPTGGRPTSYSITTTPTTTTTTATSGPVTITGLSSATSYTVTVSGTNSANSTSASSTSSSITATTVPQNPTVGTPTVATGQAYGATASVSVPFTAGATGGSTITGYTVTSSSGNTGTGASSPVSVTGETISVARTYTVTATNANGTSTASSASAATTPSTVPQAPTIGVYTDGGTGTTGTLSFTAGATGGSAITGYKVSTDGSTYTTVSGTTSPLSLTGLTPGTYTFTIKATNVNGDSTASSGVSGTVIDPAAYVSIATQSYGAGGYGQSITFSSIPQTYKHLQLRINQSTNSGNNIRLQINGDTNANYSGHQLTGDGGSVYSGYQSAAYGWLYIAYSVGTQGTPHVAIMDLPDYTNTNKYKTVRTLEGNDINGAGGWIGMWSGNWRNTAAVTSLTVYIPSGYFTEYSTFSLYGIKG